MLETEATGDFPLVPPVPPEPSPSVEQVEEGVQTDVPPQPPQLPTVTQQVVQQQQNITLSPTFNRHTEQHLTFGLPPDQHLRPVRTPSRKPRARSRTPI